MKVLALILACVVATAQGRSAKAATTAVGKAAVLGENPWLVHLRLAVSTSGYLNTCAGSLIQESWVLTSATCIRDARFIWLRYGLVNVVNPELVTESTTIRVHTTDDVGLIGINRFVSRTDNIAPLRLESSNAVMPSAGRFCHWGADDSGVPGEILKCYDVELSSSRGAIVAEVEATRFDTGAALVTDGVQTGILVDWQGGVARFLRPGAYIDWIRLQTGHNLGS